MRRLDVLLRIALLHCGGPAAPREGAAAIPTATEAPATPPMPDVPARPTRAALLAPPTSRLPAVTATPVPPECVPTPPGAGPEEGATTMRIHGCVLRHAPRRPFSEVRVQLSGNGNTLSVGVDEVGHYTLEVPADWPAGEYSLQVDPAIRTCADMVRPYPTTGRQQIVAGGCFLQPPRTGDLQPGSDLGIDLATP